MELLPLMGKTRTIDGYVYGGGHGSDDYQHPTTIDVQGR